jgi:hypothetical protein
MNKQYRRASAEKTRDASQQVSQPTRETEFEVQAFLWSELRAMGLCARGEVKTTFAGRAVVRFDIGIFSGEKLAAIIECKHEGKQQSTDWTKTRQGDRYAQYGVPVYLVRGMSEAKDLLVKAKSVGLF